MMNTLYNKAIDWICKTAWPVIDPQEQWLSMQIDITNACNLRCDHCYHPDHNNRGALDFEDWKKVLEQYHRLLKKLRMKPRITICGGEPTSCVYLFQLLAAIRDRFGACDINLLSNGTLIDETIAKKLKQYNVNVQISLDGPDAERNDSIRGKGSFGAAVAGSQILKENGVSFHHLAVLSKRTVAWIEDFFKLPTLTGAGSMNFIRLVSEGHAKKLAEKGEDQPLLGAQLEEAFKKILSTSRKSGVLTYTNDALWHLLEQGLGSPNNVGISGFTIGYKGGFKVSSRTSLVLGNVLTDGMEKLFLNSSVMKKLRSGAIEVCNDCKFFRKCRGDRNASYAAYGHFFGPDPGCWILSDVKNGISFQKAV